jgi:hypothetical protein
MSDQCYEEGLAAAGGVMDCSMRSEPMDSDRALASTMRCTVEASFRLVSWLQCSPRGPGARKGGSLLPWWRPTWSTRTRQRTPPRG